MSEGDRMRLSVDEMQANLEDGWSFTTPLQRYRGGIWYPMAHDFAWIIGHGDVRMGAGLLAAMSPQKQWDVNRRIAVDASQGVFGGQVTDAVNKARRIALGEDPANVLPMGKKTGHFFMNILEPTNSDYVTIDRHMIRVLTLDWDNGQPRITNAQYGDCVLATQKAAANVGVAAPVLQATLWLYALERR
jgi:hypothetical protein